MVTFEEMNDYSRRFAARLFEEYPEWQLMARLNGWPNMDPGAFLVEVSSNALPELPLWITTDGGEITVGCGEIWHSHYGDWTGASEPESFSEALKDLAQVLAGELLIAAAYEAGVFRWSTILRQGDELKLERADRIDVLSWRDGLVRQVAA